MLHQHSPSISAWPRCHAEHKNVFNRRNLRLDKDCSRALCRERSQQAAAADYRLLRTLDARFNPDDGSNVHFGEALL